MYSDAVTETNVIRHLVLVWADRTFEHRLSLIYFSLFADLSRGIVFRSFALDC